MRALFILIVWIALGTADADPNPQEQAFLTVTGAAWHYTNAIPRAFQPLELPPGLLKQLEGYDWGTNAGGLPNEFHGFTLDLNKDGKNEYFIETIYGGSGGPDYMIFAQTSGSWRSIGCYQGVIHVMPAESGWPQLVTTSRGGGGNYAKIYHAFRSGRYEKTLVERYERGKITREIIEPK
jgi:hypothetical protein